MWEKLYAKLNFNNRKINLWKCKYLKIGIRSKNVRNRAKCCYQKGIMCYIVSLRLNHDKNLISLSKRSWSYLVKGVFGIAEVNAYLLFGLFVMVLSSPSCCIICCWLKEQFPPALGFPTLLFHFLSTPHCSNCGPACNSMFLFQFLVNLSKC